MIFLSYSHRDTSLANELIRELSEKGLKVWQDVREVPTGALIPIDVSNALSSCSGFCVLITANSVSSNWVKAELSSAFMRWTQDPSSVTIFPVVTDRQYLPAILSGMNYLDARAETPQEIAARVVDTLHMKQRPLPSGSMNWVDLVSAIENDQFRDEPSSHRYGGWSRSFSVNYLPLAFPTQIPDTVSRIDSLTSTHWAIRGLCSLRRILLGVGDELSLVRRIDTALFLSRGYLLKHFDENGVGLIRTTAEGEKKFPHFRHGATFAKALLQLGCEPIQSVQMAIEYSLRNFDENDGRLSSYAEAYHLIGLIRAYPELWPDSVSQEMVNQLKVGIENDICKMSGQFAVGRESIRLLGHTSQWHMSPYYTWWVLDACGDLLLQSENPKVRELAGDVLSGLDKLRIIDEDGSMAYPLNLGGVSDLGASAQIGEVLLRFAQESYAETANKVADFVSKRLTRRYLAEYAHHELLWAVPLFWERHRSLQKIQTS